MTRVFRALGVVVVGLLLVATTVVIDRAEVSDRSELASVELGLPLALVAQDQSGLDRSLPGQARLASPWEHPVEVRPIGLAVDLLVVSGTLLLLLGASRGRRTRVAGREDNRVGNVGGLA